MRVFRNLLVKEMFAAKPDFSIERFKAMSTCDANEHLPQHRFPINQNWLTDHGYANEEEYFDLARRLDPNFNHRQDNHQFVAAILTVLEEEREKNLKAHCQLNKEGGKQQQSGSGGQMKLNKKGLPKCFGMFYANNSSKEAAPPELRAEADHRFQLVCRPEDSLPVRVHRASGTHLERVARLRLERL